jgi:hypothetical protein
LYLSPKSVIFANRGLSVLKNLRNNLHEDDRTAAGKALSAKGMITQVDAFRALTTGG